MTKQDLVAELKDTIESAKTVTVSVNRFGYTIDGNRYRRVTTLLGGIPKPALVGWGIKSVAEFAIEHKDQWEDLPKADALKLLKGSPYSKRDAAGDRGTAVLKTLEALITPGKEIPEDLTEDEQACADSATEFLVDRDAQILASELTVFSPSHGYAGTLDLWDIDKDGVPWILDWKTSKGIYGDHGVQQVAYQNAEFAVVQKQAVDGKKDTWTGKVIPWKREYAQSLGIVHVEPTGATLYTVADPDKLWKVFRAASFIKGWLLDSDSYRGKTPREAVYLDPITISNGGAK